MEALGGHPGQPVSARAQITGARVAALDDHELMLRVQRAEDTAAFAALYERHGGRAYGLARRICVNHDAGCAAEAVQEGFLAVWRHRSRYRAERGTVQAWILAIVRNQAIDVLRQQRARPPGAHAPRTVEARCSGYRVDDEVERHDEAARLHEQLGNLPAAQREVIELAYLAGLSHREIAVALGLPLGTVKGRMRLGLGKLRMAAAAKFRPPDREVDPRTADVPAAWRHEVPGQ